MGGVIGWVAKRSRFFALAARLERMADAERAELFALLRCTLPAGVLRADRDTVRALRNAYLLEFGEDGYTSETFIDFVAAAVDVDLSKRALELAEATRGKPTT